VSILYKCPNTKNLCPCPHRDPHLCQNPHPHPHQQILPRKITAILKMKILFGGRKLIKAQIAAEGKLSKKQVDVCEEKLVDAERVQEKAVLENIKNRYNI